MGKNNLNYKILEAYGFTPDKLEFYEKLFDNFECDLKNIMGTITAFVKLNEYPKTLEDLAKKLEEVKIINEKPKSDVKDYSSREKETKRLNYDGFSLIKDTVKNPIYSLDLDQVAGEILFVS